MTPGSAITRRLVLGLAASAVVCALGGRRSGADEVPPAGVDGLIADLGRTPSVEAVRALVAHPKVKADAVTARRVAEVLSLTPGAASASGLMTLAVHVDPGVRALALHGVARLRIRLSDGVAGVRQNLRDADTDVRSAAFDAMGVVADASDIPGLLEDIASDCPIGSGCAYRSLLRLTELRMPAEPRKWRDWWASAEKDVPARLDAALAHVVSDEGPKEEDFALVGRFAWVDLSKVHEAVHTCLRSSEPRQHARGYRLVAVARLGDLAEEVRSNLRYERDPAAFAAGAPAATLLGLRIDDAILVLNRADAPR